jgi:hypothetical protein
MPEPFSWDRLRRLLRRSHELGYEPRLFGDQGRPGRFVLWRHDIDLELEAAVALAELEAEEGVRSTFFLMARSAFYNLFSPAGEEAARRIAGLGHALGVHVDLGATRDAHLDDEQIRERVAREQSLVEAALPGLFDRWVSFHNPPADVVGRDVPGVQSAYGPAFLRDVRYASDSLRRFAGGPFEEVLEAGHERLCLLLHPVLWAYDGSTMPEAVAAYLAARTERDRAELIRGGALPG